MLQGGSLSNLKWPIFLPMSAYLMLSNNKSNKKNIILGK